MRLLWKVLAPKWDTQDLGMGVEREVSGAQEDFSPTSSQPNLLSPFTVTHISDAHDSVKKSPSDCDLGRKELCPGSVAPQKGPGRPTECL